MPPRKKGDPVGGKTRTGVKGVHRNWIRTGGAVGDDSMAEMNRYNEEGAGVDESKIIDCNGDPNADLEGRKLPGSES